MKISYCWKGTLALNLSISFLTLIQGSQQQGHTLLWIHFTCVCRLKCQYDQKECPCCITFVMKRIFLNSVFCKLSAVFEHICFVKVSKYHDEAFCISWQEANVYAQAWLTMCRDMLSQEVSCQIITLLRLGSIMCNFVIFLNFIWM